LGNNNTLSHHEWPAYDENKLAKNSVKLAVQINGKVRAQIEVEVDASKEEVLAIAYEQESLKQHIEGKSIVKEIVVPNRIVNIVVK
jgi:leucyl-tRNA synthetase